MTDGDRNTTKREVTIRDVAAAAGVSIATVSKALNGRQHVRSDTRERVQRVAAELGFSPNASARSLAEGRTGTVGLITNDLEGRFSIPALMGAEDAFGVGNASVFLCDARGDTIRERHHLRALLSRRVDGIIVVGDRTDPRPSLGRALPVPVVYAYAPSDDPDDVSVIADNVDAGRLAAEHLLMLGRTRVAYISGRRAISPHAIESSEQLQRWPLPVSNLSAVPPSTGRGAKCGGAAPPKCCSTDTRTSMQSWPAPIR